MGDRDDWEDIDDDVEMELQPDESEPGEDDSQSSVSEDDDVPMTVQPGLVRNILQTIADSVRPSGHESQAEDVEMNPNCSWDRLPYELSHKILQTLAEDEARSHLMAEYAVVCKAWQAEIEEVNFRTLAVKQSDLQQLDEYVTGRRRALLRHLWLQVELSEYSRRSRLVPENEQDQEENNVKYSMALADLFKLLESWNTPEFWSSRNGRGINLELSAFSPSDKRNLFGEAGLDADGNSRYFDSLLDFMLLVVPDPQGIHGLHMVEVVTSFSILRRNFRNVSATSLTPILRSLPRLQEVRFEPWQQVDQAAQEDVDSELAGQLPFWPTTLKRISIFEHFGAFDQNDLWDTRIRFPFLAHGLRRLSTHLQDLSVSFAVDAKDFFQPWAAAACAPAPTAGPSQPCRWEHLRWLTLTSRMIAEVAFPDEINSLLRAAGLAAASSMPALQAMELYNATRWDAGVFRFLVVDNTAVVSWTSTWEFRVAAAVRRVWREVALARTRREPVVFDEVRMADYKGGPEGFVHSELATRELVLHPSSSGDMMGDRPFPEPVLRLPAI
ncbi:hypothetical protein KVR01_009221 [Diaporthe batatas]|uniref:uncharacterized protein n=1 Tax=Diaporthe batatas TaxID=748121 RepID=UPI001D0409EF|nr:uncharacterized protein KVR01_009221 [Diaporthe batatas]KAG8160957.1 hypothetical protein KVR01_009221 [Diaporthe batatas]